MVILKSDKVNLTSYIFKRQKKHHVLKKGSIHQGDTAILSLYALDIEAPKPMKPKLAEDKNRQFYSNSRNFNTAI